MAAFWRRPGLFGRVSTYNRLGHTLAGQKIWLPKGEPYIAGDMPQQHDLANTYLHLANAGPDDFYNGALADVIIEDFKQNGALITEEDIRNYTCDWLDPIKGSFLGYDILSTPLPGGGLALLQSLRMAELFNVLNHPLNSKEYVHILSKIYSAIQHDRMTQQSDPRFSVPDINKLLSNEYLNTLYHGFNPKSSLDPKDTTVIGVADKEGNAIVLCHSLGYGSGVFTKGLGFMYNNAMSGFDPEPNTANSIAPGKARSTAIAQTLILKNGAPRLILGSPGGSHITAGISQVLLNHLHFGLDIQDAVCRPRFDAYKDNIIFESRMPYTLEEELTDWKINRSPRPFGMVGRIYAIAFTDHGLKPGYDPGEAATAMELK